MKNNFVYINNIKPYAVCSGIRPKDFILSCYNTNYILIAKGDFLGDRNIKKFEIFDNVNEFLKCLNGDYFGDLCFLDFKEKNSPKNLKYNEIADILYCAHMFEGKRIFFETLKNTFFLFSHDNGFYSKIYYNTDDIIKRLTERKMLEIFRKKLKNDPNKIPYDIINSLINLFELGILIDYEDFYTNKSTDVNLIKVGNIVDMDCIYNDIKEIRHSCELKGKINYVDGKWLLDIY